MLIISSFRTRDLLILTLAIPYIYTVVYTCTFWRQLKTLQRATIYTLHILSDVKDGSHALQVAATMAG